ncbi:hypothetical protein N7495_007084 [Penicillium taxi]|uniref:uncharacterized protein n=1 Tax=Penicillium taxi TaxID=168475 RepID=UPI002544F76B|nr:uncharacterized protein N7495_007084 [Penicillium taxi]KAJ5895393.1 hypothetical protein N7495_007084 [Penicillium taxi]
MSSNNIAFTSPINAPDQTPLTISEVWAGLLLKIKRAELFVPAAIKSTEVLSETTDPQTGAPVTTRNVVFHENERKVKEIVTAYKPCRIEFEQPDGSKISNVVSEGAGGSLYLTYIFEWRHPGVSIEELAALAEKEKKMSKDAVEGTITALRQLVEEGSLLQG